MERPAKKSPAILLFASLWLAGCAALPGHTAEPPLIDAQPGLVARMTAIGARLEELGYSPSGWYRSGELGPGETETAPLRTSASGRLVLVAVGSAEQANLDLTVRGPGGGLEVKDEAADFRTAVEIATMRRARYSVALSNAATHAETGYLLRAFAAPLSTEPAPLFGLFDADPLRDPSWNDVEARMAAAGMTSAGPARDLQAGRGERVSDVVRLAEGRCYMFVAQGSPGVDSLAIRLSARESLIAADLAERPEAWVRHCAETEREARLTIEVLAGSGNVRSGTFTALREDLDPEVVGPPLRPREPLTTVSGAMRWTDQRLARSGYDPAEILFEGEIDTGERRRSRVKLARGECAALSAISGVGIDDLDLEVESADGGLLAADSTHGPSALVRLCASETSEYTAAIVCRGGRGHAVLMVNRLPRVDLSSLTGDVPRAAREAAALFHRRSLVPLTRLDPPVPNDADDSPGWTVSTELEAGRCYGITAATDGFGISRLELRRASGEIVASWQRDGLPAAVTSCTTEAERYDIRIVPMEGGPRSPPVVLLFGSP